MDHDLRALERLALAGDLEAARRLEVAKGRAARADDEAGLGPGALGVTWDDVTVVHAYRLAPVPGQVEPMTFLVLDHVNGDFVEVCDADPVFDRLLLELSRRLAQPVATLRERLRRLAPGPEHEDVLFSRPP